MASSWSEDSVLSEKTKIFHPIATTTYNGYSAVSNDEPSNRWTQHGASEVSQSDKKAAPRGRAQSVPFHKRRAGRFESYDFSRSPSTTKYKQRGDSLDRAGNRIEEYDHTHPESMTRWAVNGVIGLCVGVTAFLLKQSINWLFDQRGLLIKKYLPPTPPSGLTPVPFDWTVHAYLHATAVAACLVLVSSFLIVFVEPRAAGSGIPETMSSLNGLLIPKAFTVKVLFCKFFSCLLAVGSGIPAGPEGPMIHMGGIIGVVISQGRFRRLIKCAPGFLGSRLEAAAQVFRNVRDRRDFMSAGVAGGVSAAFGAPVGGLLFVAEEIATHWGVQLGMQIFFCAIVGCTTVELLSSAFKGFQLDRQTAGVVQDEDAMMFMVNVPIHVNFVMFFPTILLGAITGLCGAFYNRCALRAAQFRGKNIRPYRALFLLEPVLGAALYMGCKFFVPTLFECVPWDCNSSGPDSSEQILGVDVCARVGRSSVEINEDGTPADILVGFGCPDKSFNPAASLLLHSMDTVLKSLFGRGFHYQFDYGALLAMLACWFPFSAYLNGISCCTGIVIPCLVSGALIGRLFGLLLTDMLGVHTGDPDKEWIDPGAFALIGAAGFFAGVSRLTMSLTVILTEISNDVHFILPIMLSIMVAKWCADYSKTEPLYHSLIDAKNFPYLQSLPHVRGLDEMTAGSAATAEVVCVYRRPKVVEVAKMLLENTHNAFPVMRKENASSAQGSSVRENLRAAAAKAAAAAGAAMEMDSSSGVFLGLVQRQQLLTLLSDESLWRDPAPGSEFSSLAPSPMSSLDSVIESGPNRQRRDSSLDYVSGRRRESSLDRRRDASLEPRRRDSSSLDRHRSSSLTGRQRDSSLDYVSGRRTQGTQGSSQGPRASSPFEGNLNDSGAGSARKHRAPSLDTITSRGIGSNSPDVERALERALLLESRRHQSSSPDRPDRSTSSPMLPPDHLESRPSLFPSLFTSATQSETRPAPASGPASGHGLEAERISLSTTPPPDRSTYGASLDRSGDKSDSGHSGSEGSGSEGDDRVHAVSAGAEPEVRASFRWLLDPVSKAELDEAKQWHDRVSAIAASGTEKVLDLSPYVDTSTFTVSHRFKLRYTYELFRTMGLRHLVVVNSSNRVVGMITRENLLERHLKTVTPQSRPRRPTDRVKTISGPN
mmetsp:Transcript_47964/g.108886  ORF Transcript_47964/g.108886 Transcript_47964/m.108886 type:complete len:1162 (-) Transcript_47964:116-3601(-)